MHATKKIDPPPLRHLSNADMERWSQADCVFHEARYQLLILNSHHPYYETLLSFLSLPDSLAMEVLLDIPVKTLTKVQHSAGVVATTV